MYDLVDGDREAAEGGGEEGGGVAEGAPVGRIDAAVQRRRDNTAKAACR